MKYELIMECKHMSAKYSLLVIAVVVAILMINSLWIKLASQQNTEIESRSTIASSAART